MASRLLLPLIGLLAPQALAQICNCPLVGISTITATCACPPPGDIFTTTSTSTAGACRNPRTTTTTTTYTAGQCVCPSSTTFTATPSSCDCPGVTATSTVVEPTIDCPWAATVTRTLTAYNVSSNPAGPTGAGGTAASTGFLPTGTPPSGTAAPSPPTPTCPIRALPLEFYIRDLSSGWYILYDASCAKATLCPHKADATAFHTNATDPDDGLGSGGVQQLSLYWPASQPDDSEEYGAYVQYEGGPVGFFQAGRVPEEGESFVVTAGWSEYLCELGLMALGLHDLADAQVCDGGYLSLGYGFGGDECPSVRLGVEAA